MLKELKKRFIVNNISHYPWSSYENYISENQGKVYTDFCFGYFSSINEEKSDDQCMDYYVRVKYKNDGLKKIIDEGIGHIGYSFKKNRVEKEKNGNRFKYQALKGS